MPTKKKPTLKSGYKLSDVTFTVDAYDGEFTLPSTQDLPVGIIRRMNDSDQLAFLDFAGKEYEDILEEMPGRVLDTFIGAWFKASGQELGESEA